MVPAPTTAPPARGRGPRPPCGQQGVSIMRRPFLFQRSQAFRCLCRRDPLRERIDSRAQRLDLLALPIYDSAQFEIGALQKGYFRFQPLDYLAVHIDSVTVTRRHRRRAAGRRQQLKPNWRYSCIDTHPGRGFQASLKPYKWHEMPVFPAPQHISNTSIKLPASLPRDVFTCRDRATRVRSRPLVCYGENRDYGQHQDLAASTPVHCGRI
jgi:hypothetical protein